MIKHHSEPKDAWPLSHLLEKLGTPQARGTPYAKKSLKIIICVRSWPWPNRRLPAAFPRTYAFSHWTPHQVWPKDLSFVWKCPTSTQRRGLLAIPGGALNEKSQGLWCIWYTGSFVSWKTKTDFKVLLSWSKKTSVRLSQTAFATTTDQPYIAEQSTFSRPPTPSLYFESQFTLMGLKS